MKTIRFIDLFAGIGGFRYGLESVGIEPTDKKPKPPKSKVQLRGKRTALETRRSILPPNNRRFRAVYSNEWDKYAAQIYKKHYGECDTTDITKVKAKDIPDHDLLCAGFPCQSFSIAGKRKGFEDTRGTLFFDIARILSEKRPRLVLLENVKGLLSHDKGKTFQTILGVLTDLGYRVEWQVLNSKHFGVPQNRERVFIIGHFGGSSGGKVFPIGQENKNDNGYTSKKKLSRQISYTLDANYYKGVSPKGYQGSKRQLIRTDKPNTQSKRDKSDSANRIRRVSYTDGARIRRLTPVEAERLQGFPDNFTKHGTDEDGNETDISDTQRYKVLGNAVTTNVITAIGEKLINL
jgi:DNA (cytosine-5)-methyltransferase 1